MRLRRLDLVRYGRFTDRSFELPTGAPDLHVLFGPNEAGKSTALSAIEDLLFGVPVNSTYDFLHSYSSMRIGGVVENDQESLEMIRRKGAKDTLLDSGDAPFPGGEAALLPFLADANRSFFERMFSLDHRRLETGGREILQAKDELGQMLFSAGTGVEGLRGRLARLSDEADGLWAKKRARHRKYYLADDRRKEAERSLRDNALSANRWVEAKKAKEAAESAHDQINSEFERISAEGARLARIRRVYRYVRRKADLEREIDDMGEVAPLPESARQAFEDAGRKEAEASARIETLSEALFGAREELETLSCDDRLMQRADEIQHLNEQRIAIRPERIDLPKRLAELAAVEDEVRALADELDWGAREVDELVARIPARGKVAAARALSGRHGELDLDLRRSAAALEEAEARPDSLRERLENAPETTDFSRLGAAIGAVRARGDLSGLVGLAEQELREAQRRVEQVLDSLQPAVSGEWDAAKMPTPSRAAVQEHRDKVRDWERRFGETDRDGERLEQERERARADLQRARRDTRAVMEEDLQDARRRRDSLWKLVKRVHIEGMALSEAGDEIPEDLAAAFEPAVREADDLADRRFEYAEAAAMLARLSRDVEEGQVRLDQLNERRERLSGEREGLDAGWRSLWGAAAFEPLGPDEMLEWLGGRDELVETIERRAEAEDALRLHRENENEARESLLTELAALGVDRSALENDALPVVLERADGMRRDLRTGAETRARLEEELREAASEVDRKRRELARAKQAWEQWQENWSEAMNDLGFSASTNPDVASARIDVIDRMREKAAKIEDLRHRRIDKIDRDIAEFEALVERVVGNLAPDLVGDDAENAVLEIKSRLEEAQRIRDRRTVKKEEIEKIEEGIRAHEQDLQEARKSVEHLLESAGVSEKDELDDAIEKSDDLRRLRSQLNDTLWTLEQEGDGLSAGDLEVECADADIDRIAAQEETNGGELKALQDRLTTVVEERAQAREAFDAIGGDDAAASAEAARQEALAEIRDISERYVRLRTSATLLRWAIDRYRRERQTPLLKRAGELFSTITGDSFGELGIGYDKKDQAHLTGVRPDGQVVEVPGMSSGTADQLYLALRIASVEDYLNRAAALPFVADDLFVNFDDGRAAAGFDVLGTLAGKTQVLFFTHHAHLVEIARKTLGDSISVIELDAEGE